MPFQAYFPKIGPHGGVTASSLIRQREPLGTFMPLGFFLCFSPSVPLWLSKDVSHSPRPRPRSGVFSACSYRLAADSIWPPWDCTQCHSHTWQHRLSWLLCSHQACPDSEDWTPQRATEPSTWDPSSLLRRPGHFAPWKPLGLLAPHFISLALACDFSAPCHLPGWCSVPASQVWCPGACSPVLFSLAS